MVTGTFADRAILTVFRPRLHFHERPLWLGLCWIFLTVAILDSIHRQHKKNDYFLYTYTDFTRKQRITALRVLVI
jgi:hypothetical protein